jgi:outer membrane protein assembly factor BamD
MFKNKGLLVFWFFLSLVVGISACKSKFDQLRASNDVTKKYQEALRLYNNKYYNKALLLFEDLVQRYRGRTEAEDLYYYYAYTNFKLKDYTTARYHFKVFAETYPNSPRAEECRFMSAKCYYLESPVYSLDQQNTVKAIDALQLFINLYPKSERVPAASKLIDDLRGKLELKSYMNAKLFLDLGDYKSAIIAFRNSTKDFPDTKYAEEMEFFSIKAQYLLAKNSFESKQEERFNEVIQLYADFSTKYPISKYLKEASQFKKSSEQGIFEVQELLASENGKEKTQKN